MKSMLIHQSAYITQHNQSAVDLLSSNQNTMIVSLTPSHLE